jgi:integrase
VGVLQRARPALALRHATRALRRHPAGRRAADPTPHDTRHTFAVNLLDWTNDIDYVAQMLGDSLTVVVAIYLKHQGARDKYDRYAGIGD